MKSKNLLALASPYVVSELWQAYESYKHIADEYEAAGFQVC